MMIALVPQQDRTLYCKSLFAVCITTYKQQVVNGEVMNGKHTSGVLPQREGTIGH